MSDFAEVLSEISDLRREVRDLSLLVIRGFRNLGEKMSTQFATLDDAVSGLTASVTNETTVESSLVALTGQLFTAYQTALQNAGGATQAQLAALAKVNDTVQANITALTAAVTANTPAAAPTPAPAPTPPAST